jgi:hypothetical protein
MDMILGCKVEFPPNLIPTNLIKGHFTHVPRAVTL